MPSTQEPSLLTIGIDATNLRLGGGITHLSELLLAADPKRDGFIRIVVWGGAKTLSQLPQKPWLSCVDCDFWQANLFLRVFMQVFLLSRLAKKAGCDLLFIPGGSYAGSFHPVITMSQSVLPFDWLAIKSNGWSFRALKFMLLRWVQASSFRRSDGVIFLTQFAKKMVLAQMGSLSVPTAVIAHGMASQFYGVPKVQQLIAAYSSKHPFVLLYVSIIDTYKHQVEVVKAAALLRSLGYPVHLRLVGPAHAPRLLQLRKVMLECDPDKTWIVDIDNVSIETFNHSEEQKKIRPLVYDLQIDTGKEPIMNFIPTKGGIHIITRPFNLNKFKTQYPEIDVHKENPTCLYFP